MKKIPAFLLIVFVFYSCSETKPPIMGVLTFDQFEAGGFETIDTKYGKWLTGDSVATIETGGAVRILGGKDKVLEFQPNKLGASAKYLSFSFRSKSRQAPDIRMEQLANGTWTVLPALGEFQWTSTGKAIMNLRVSDSHDKIRMVTNSQSGLLLESVKFLSDASMSIDTVYSDQNIAPVLVGKDNNPILRISIESVGIDNPLGVLTMDIATTGSTDISNIEEVKVFFTGVDERFHTANQFGEAMAPSKKITFQGQAQLQHGTNHFWISYKLKESASLLNKVDANLEEVGLTNGKTYEVAAMKENYANRIGRALRQHWDDSVHTYRIPGLATTNKGTLVAVYDMRYNSSVDLQEDVDVGMSRSTDGGDTWEPMKIIMDMEEWGGKADSHNGIGDPSILVDRATNTIWVAGIWAHGHPGKRNWWASKPGLAPVETSQFVLVKSEDDGLTWSGPINITRQIKLSKWHLLLQGPGKGITMKNGTLVFPAQFKDENQVPHSTLIYSEDHGKTWKIGTGVRKQTTEAQVVELPDGSLMINARNNDARNKKGVGRVVATTTDMGKTWQEHPSSVVALEESTCMASLINEEVQGYGDVLFFSNPNTHSGRFNMTIKASLDQGKTWPDSYQLLLDEGHGRGYSCMTRIDENTLGILYEGSQADLIFEKVRISEILR